jgi:hypothetical protein
MQLPSSDLIKSSTSGTYKTARVTGPRVYPHTKFRGQSITLSLQLFRLRVAYDQLTHFNRGKSLGTKEFCKLRLEWLM